jgi:hypothetical protein
MGAGMKEDPKLIKMWRFEDAPQELQELSTNGGDEDWLFLLPHGMNTEGLWWMENALNIVNEYKTSTGQICIITAHS